MKAEFNKLNIHLSKEELAILQGKNGSVMQKVMKTVVLYGEALDAEKLADIEGPGHFVISFSREGIAPPIRILEELVDAGLRTKFPFTLDPRGALDFENLNLQPGVEQALLDMYQNQEYYEQLLPKLGSRND